MKKIIIGFLMVGILAPIAHADDSHGGLFVEPAITYESGETTTDYPAPFSDSTGSSRGYGIGARLGFHIYEAFFIGIDGRYSQPDFSDSAYGYNAKSVATNYGPVVGFQMPNIGLRIWGSYVLGGELNPEASNGFDVKYQNPNGYRVGAGFRIAAISLNLEYEDSKYDKATLEQAGTFTPGTSFDNVELQNKTWITSLSFPMEF